ncbi:unnamed protein product, partial [Prunus brigantina]
LANSSPRPSVKAPPHRRRRRGWRVKECSGSTFKGLVSEEMVGNERCDSRDNLVFEVWKPLIGNGMSKNGALLKALIEGLNAALALDLKRITFFCENFPIFLVCELLSLLCLVSIY